MFAPNLLMCHNFGYLENFRPHSSIQVDSKGSFSILPPFPNPPFVLLFILLFTYYLIAVSPRGLPAPHSLHNTHTYTHMNPTTTSPPSLKQSQIPPILYKEASSSLHPLTSQSLVSIISAPSVPLKQLSPRSLFQQIQ